MARFDDAVDSYTRCFGLRPQHVDAHHNRALTWLRQGNFARGWAEYESRLRKRSLSKRPQNQPAWNGFPPSGLTILPIAEQGLGDSLQFIRYAPLLKARGATVIFECPERLLSSTFADFTAMKFANDYLNLSGASHPSHASFPGIIV